VSKILLDANLSYRTANFLRDRFGFDAVTVEDLISRDAKDEDVVELAIATGRTIVSFDLGFGRLYFRRSHGRCGIIILRLSNQRVDATNRTLEDLFGSPLHASVDFSRSQVIVDDLKIRVSTLP
jgi:predicted nuclease of predicted toxin-antitoxin system